jgi:hypothetical protein
MAPQLGAVASIPAEDAARHQSSKSSPLRMSVRHRGLWSHTRTSAEAILRLKPDGLAISAIATRLWNLLEVGTE